MPLSDLLTVMQSIGLSPAQIVPGKWIRFPGIGKKSNNKAGYCYLFPDMLGAVFGDYACGLRETWQAEKMESFTPAERIDYQKMIESAQKKAVEEQEREYSEAAFRAQREWDVLPASTDEHLYLMKKRVKNHGLRQKNDLLIMPIYSTEGRITSYQSIAPDGTKKLMYGGRKKGSAFPIPGSMNRVYIVEGYATGASVHEATGCMVIVAVDAGNLLSVAVSASKKYPNIIVCADNDKAGLDAARKVEAETGIPFIYPENISGTDFNDMASELGLSAVTDAMIRGRMIRPYQKQSIQSSSYPDEIFNPPGLLKVIADYYSATAVRPQPLFGIAAGLALGSVVLGRRYRTEYKNYTSLYMIVASKSGTGKDHVKQVCREIMKAAGIEWMERSEGFTAANTVIKSLENQPLQISFFEEIGLRLQEAATNPRSSSRGTFRKLLDIFSSCHSFSVSEEYADNSVHRVDRPALTMVGLTTPRALTGAINESLIEQGFVNRILPFISREDRCCAPLDISSCNTPVPDEITEWVKDVWLKGNISEAGVPCCPGVENEIVVPFTVESIAELNRIDADIVEMANGLEKHGLDDMISRNREIAMRVALIAAVMDGQTDVGVVYIRWAWKLVYYLYSRYIEEIRRNVSGSDYEKSKLEALTALRSAGKDGVRPADMPKVRPWSKWPHKLRSEILGELQSSGLADRGKIRTGKVGQPKDVWIALE